MIKIGEITKQPTNAGWYKVLKIVLLLSVITLPILFVSSSQQWFSVWFSLMLLLGLPLSIWVLLDNKATNFIVDNNKIEINWGIVMKKSRSILVKAIQNIKIERGILPNLCGVWIVNIWTASPSQMNMSNKKEGNKPDGLLILNKEDAKWVNDFVASGRPN